MLRLAIFTLLTTTLLAAVSHATAISGAQVGSNGGVMWEDNCDYPHNDYRSVNGASASCGDTCVGDATCTHWAWSAFNGGTCWLKQGMYSKTTSNGTTCGYVISRSEEVTALTSGLSIADMADHVVKAASLYSQDQASHCKSQTTSSYGNRLNAQGYIHYIAEEFAAEGQTTVKDVMMWWWSETPSRIFDKIYVNVGFALAMNDACTNSKTYWTIPWRSCLLASAAFVFLLALANNEAMLLLANFALFASLIVAAAHASSTAEVQTGSNGRVMWEYNCDYSGHDYRSLIGISEICGDTCANDATCTHWTWSAFNGGTCWLKKGIPSTKTTSTGAICGYVVSRSLAETASTSGLSIAGMTNMLNRINAHREQAGNKSGSALSIDYRLVKAASLHSLDQAGHCNKNMSTSTAFLNRVKAQGYTYYIVWENVAAGQTTVADVMASWWNEKEVRANMLYKYYVDVGFALAKNDACTNAKTYWTVEFGQPL